jgi:hypothetical protein
MSLIKTLRQPKLFDMAIFDFSATFLAAYLVHKYLKIECSLWSVFAGFVGVGVLVHILTETPTMLNYYLGLSEKPIR